MEEKVVFKNSKGDSLVGVLSTPTFNPKNAIVILCHGSDSSKDSNTYLEMENVLKTNNFASLRFDFYGHGESAGKFEDITVSEAVDDILQVIEFVKDRGFKKIALFGSSFGGCASIIAASKTDDLSALILRSPVSDYKNLEISRFTAEELKEWKEKGYTYKSEAGGEKKMNYSYLEDLLKLNEYEAAKNINIPTFISHGDQDSVVPLEQSLRLKNVIRESRLLISKGAKHRYSEQPEKQKEEFKQALISFLNEVL